LAALLLRQGASQFSILSPGDANRRTSETDWQDVASLVRKTDQNIEDAELQAIISQYGGPLALAELRKRLGNF
jgi:hypothetical protein